MNIDIGALPSIDPGLFSEDAEKVLFNRSFKVRKAKWVALLKICPMKRGFKRRLSVIENTTE